MDPTQRSIWLLEWIGNEIQNRHDEIGIKRIYNDIVKVFQITLSRLIFYSAFDFPLGPRNRKLPPSIP